MCIRPRNRSNDRAKSSAAKDYPSNFDKEAQGIWNSSANAGLKVNKRGLHPFEEGDLLKYQRDIRCGKSSGVATISLMSKLV